MSPESPTESGAEPLSLERHAEVVAALNAVPASETEGRLAELGLTSAAWERSKAFWDHALEEDLGGGGELLLRWTTAYEQAKAELEAEAVAAAALREIGEEPTTSPPSVAPIVVPTVPTYLRDPGTGDAAPRASPPARKKDVGTMELKAVPPVVPLPFAGDDSPLAKPDHPAGATPPKPARPGLGSTAPLPNVQKIIAALPFRGAPRSTAPAPAANAVSAQPPDLTLEQWASLRAELTTTPNRKAEIYRRYFVKSDAALEAANASWAARFAADPALAGRFDDYLRQYLAWLAQRR
jgi:hypothetical protein